MGVDISGINPIIKGERPQEPEWEFASEYEKEMYFNEMDAWHTFNPGVYFRSNWWGWRPIHAIADIAIKATGLDFDTSDWGHNDGGGLKTQEDCNALADAMEALMIINKKEMHDEDDRFYLNLGMWCDVNGGFIEENITEELNKEHPYGTILYRGVVSSKGQLVVPSHSAPLYHITNFITFLRNCGGFEIF